MTPTENPRTRLTRRRDFAPAIATFGVLFYVLRVIGAVWRSDIALSFPDSFSYLSVAKLGPFNPQFWFTDRPVGTPLLLWLCGLNTRLFFLLQTVLFALSVILLSHTVFGLMKNRFISWLTAVGLAALSMHPRFGLWHLEVLSESLGLSLSLIVLALWLRVAQDITPRRVRWAIAATIFWTITRDAHVVTAVVIIAILALLLRHLTTRDSPPATVHRSVRRGIAALALTVLYVVAAQSISDRNQYPLMNNIGLRILPNEEMTQAFVNRGMPESDALFARVGSDTWDDEESFLRSPDLAEFRSWVKGNGQIVQMSSLIIDANFWLDITADVLPPALTYNFADYDRFSTSERLPDRLFWLAPMQTPTSFGLTLLLASGVAIALITKTQRRSIGIVITGGLLASGLDLYLSASGDAVEVFRHLLGPILRLSVLSIVAIGLGADWAWSRLLATRQSIRQSTPTRQPVRGQLSLTTSVSASVAILGAFVTWIGLEDRTRDFDPQYVRTIIERAATYGGSYYENGIHNKGPLETALYDSVRLFTSYESFWFGISAYVVIISALLGITAWLIARSIGASLVLAATAGSVVAIHFSLSSSDYAGVLYSRNITSGLLALVLVITLWPRCWITTRRSTTNFLFSGVIIGLAVQTLLTTVFAGAVMTWFVIAHRGSSTSLRRPITTMATTIASTILLAPLWYLVRGSFNEFWSGWWTYARFMSSGTGRSLNEQFGQGGSYFVGYYQDRPAVLIAIAVFAVITWGEWSSFSPTRRRLHLVLTMWFMAAWVELVLAQRYSSHYFSVVAIPTAFMVVISVITVIQALGDRRAAATSGQISLRSTSGSHFRRASYGTALGLSCALLAVQGTDQFWTGIEGASRFRNTSSYAEKRNEFQNGAERTSRAIMDLVSTKGDPLLAWTMYPWTYLNHERVAATRFIWKSFMIGEIYLGRTSSDYVLDETWTWFTKDLAQSRPEVYVRPIETNLVEDIPFNGFIDDGFTRVYSGPDLEISVSRYRWEQIQSLVQPRSLLGANSPLDLSPIEPASIGWTINFPSPTSMDITADQADAPLMISTGTCYRVDGTMNGEDSSIRFLFIDAAEMKETVHLGFDFEKAWSGSESTRYLEHALALAPDNAENFSLIIGSQSAALIVGQDIVAAIRLDGSVNLAIESGSADLNVDDITISDAPSLYGC